MAWNWEKVSPEDATVTLYLIRQVVCDGCVSSMWHFALTWSRPENWSDHTVRTITATCTEMMKDNQQVAIAIVRSYAEIEKRFSVDTVVVMPEHTELIS